MFGGMRGEPLWCPNVPIGERYVRGATPSVIHHFYEKLLRVEDDVLTATAKTLAQERHQYMVEFLTRTGQRVGRHLLSGVTVRPNECKRIAEALSDDS